MNYLITAFILMSLMPLGAYAQTVNRKKETTVITSQPAMPGVTKGYYSIYHNREKLNTGKPVATVQVAGVTSPVAKGYYAIGDKHTTIYTSGYSVIPRRVSRPFAAKGYYSVYRHPVKKVRIDSAVEYSSGSVRRVGRDSAR